MRHFYFSVVFAVLIVAPAWGATKYVDGTTTSCSTPSDTDYDPATETCGSGTATVYSTVQAGLKGLAASDVLYIRAGTYNINATYGNAADETYGKGATSWETATRVQNYPGETVTIGGGFNMDNSLANGGAAYLIWEGDSRSRFVLEGASQSQDITGFRVNQGAHHVRFKTLTVKNYKNHGITGGGGCTVRPSNIEIIDTLIQNNGDAVASPGSQHEHGLYPVCADAWLVERNYFFQNFSTQIHFNNASSSTAFTNNVIRYNTIEGRSSGASGGSGIVLWGGTSNTIYRNLIIGRGSATGTLTIGVQVTAGSANKVYHNTIYGSTYGVALYFSGTGQLITNNIMNNVTQSVHVSGGAGTVSYNMCVEALCGYASATNSTVTATAGFTSAGTNFSLAAGSAAIAAGTSLAGFSCNGTCDLGAFETFAGYSSATINQNSLDVTVGQSVATHVPVIPATGMTGFSVTVGGVARTVTSAARLTGSDGVIRLTLSGAVCAGGETWLVSYSGGNVTDSALMGNSMNQPMSSFSGQAVTNNCGAAPPSDPGTKYIYYKFEDGSGTSANDETANNLDGTLTNSPVFTATGGHNSTGGVTLTDGANQYVAVPYGNAVNPSTQSLTIALSVNVDAALVNSGRTYFGASLGTNQRFYISTLSGTWRIGIQTSNDGTASNLAVTAGEHRLCLVADSGSDIATLYVDGVAGTTGASKTYTSYALASNFRIGNPFDSAVSGPGTTVDEFMLYQSAVSCADDYQIWNQTPQAPAGTYEQKTHKHQRLRKTGAGAAEDFGTAGGSVRVMPTGAVDVVIQVDCTGADCDPLGLRLRYSKNSGAYTTIPDDFTADGIAFYGVTGDADVVSGTISCCLTGALTANDGTTNFTSAATPTVDLTLNSSLVQRYALRFNATVGDTFDLRAYSSDGNALDTYTTTPRITIADYAAGF